MNRKQTLTAEMKQLLEACGCRPLRCHVCTKPMQLGQEVGWHEPVDSDSTLGHWECRAGEYQLERDPELLKKLREEMNRVSNLFEAIKGGWQSETVTAGCALSYEDMRNLGVVP